MKRAIVALLLCACTSVAQLTAVRAGRLIDPDSGTVLTAQTVLIQGNKIQAKQECPLSLIVFHSK